MKGKHEICTMQILLIAATEKEIEPFTATNPAVDFLITGVGVPKTLYHLQKRLHQIEYDFTSPQMISLQSIFLKAGISVSKLRPSLTAPWYKMNLSFFSDGMISLSKAMFLITV